ncbi:hypothetical protein GCM10009827_001840 [Dactylosporangium maewongense]|uniref:Uncharacterized protein n=1 Tax=Dactylosporangium maewongense TaxID=634393 RepID=A0ABN1ZHX0_9ACTN
MPEQARANSSRLVTWYLSANAFDTANTSCAAAGDARPKDRPSSPPRFPAEDRDVVDDRQVQLGHRRPGQRLLGRAYAVPELPPLPQVLRGGGVAQPLPRPRRPGGVHRAEVADDRRVDVQPAGLQEALVGQDREPVGVAPDGRRVEGAGAEVVHDDAAADRDRDALRRGEPGRRRDRLRHQPHRTQPRVRGRVEQDLPPARPPRRRACQHGLGRCRPGDPLRLRGDPPQHRRDELPHGHLDGPEQHGRVVDAALRVGLQALRPHPAAVQRVAPGEQPPVLTAVHRGRQRRAPVEDQRPDRPVGPAERGHGVCRPEVDAEPDPNPADHRAILDRVHGQARRRCERGAGPEAVGISINCCTARQHTPCGRT